MKRAKPTLWLAFGLVSMTVMLAVVAHSLGLMPDGRRAELEARATVAEALAVQVAGAAMRNDGDAMNETLSAVVERNPDVLSIALLGPDGTVLLERGGHRDHWVAPADGASTPTHVLVPLEDASGPQGRVEIAFVPPASASVYGVPLGFLGFVAFLAGAGFIGYYFLLRRTLKQLDPGRVVPERVRRAFDTLSEGVVLLDERERVLLVNDPFVAILGEEIKPGTSINALAWRVAEDLDGEGDDGTIWRTAMQERREIRERPLGLRTKGGTMLDLAVGAACITGERDEVMGAIVTVGDVTRLKRSQVELTQTAARLAQRERQVAQQTQELEYLTTHDALSGCLNRRTFLSRLERALGASDAAMAVLVIEIDGFHAIADRHGPAVTDRLVAGMGALLREDMPAGVLVARHRGEEFVLAAAIDATDARALADALQSKILARSDELLPGHEGLSVSIGIGARTGPDDTAHHIIRRADGDLGTRERGGAALPLPASDAAIAVADSGRPAFEAALATTLARAERTERPVGVVRARLGSFAYLREALGGALIHQLMDAVVVATRDAMRASDRATVLHDSGEVLLELNEIEGPDDVRYTVARIEEKLRSALHVGGRDIFVAAQFGAALFPGDGRDAATLTDHASVALNRAVEEDAVSNEGGGVRFYSGEMVQAAEWRMNVESGIREALLNDQFELFFQPIVCAKTRAVAAAEALLRCTNPLLEGVRIDQIIDVAEKSNLSEAVDTWVVARALAQMHAWCDVGLTLPKVSINVSARQLSNAAFMDRVFAMMRAVRFSPTRVQIEVTETARMADVDVAAPHLKRLQGLGVQIALDDFGTGQASLTYLQRLHPDTLKIDRSFVTGVTTSHANATLVAAMTVMAQSLGVRVTVEGVEDEEQFLFLRETGCDEIQGYHVSKPLSEAAMTDWLTRYVAANGTTAFVREGVALAA